MLKEVSLIKNEFAEFKKQVPGDVTKKDDDQKHKTDLSKLSVSQRLLALRKEAAIK
jgi:hypothetical protein